MHLVRCTSLLIDARNYTVTIPKGIKRARRRTDYIYNLCTPVSKSTLYSVSRNYVRSINRQVYTASIRVSIVWYTRPVHLSLSLSLYNSLIHFTYQYLRYRWIVVVIVISCDYDIAVTIVTILPKSLHPFVPSRAEVQ